MSDEQLTRRELVARAAGLVAVAALPTLGYAPVAAARGAVDPRLKSLDMAVRGPVLTPGRAVIWAAFFNFVAAFTFGTAVASTVGSGMIDIKIVTFAVIFTSQHPGFDAELGTGLICQFDANAPEGLRGDGRNPQTLGYGPKTPGHQVVMTHGCANVGGK